MLRLIFKKIKVFGRVEGGGSPHLTIYDDVLMCFRTMLVKF